MNVKLKDQDIRQLLITKLKHEYASIKDTKIVNEMGVLHGQSRIDVAVINGILHGFEIKSESDTLDRLPSQMQDYNKIFDRVTIVTQRKFLAQVKEIVPKWWGIWLVVKSGDEHTIQEIRKGRINREIDLESLCRLMWRQEAITILKEKDLHKGFLSKPRSNLYKRMAEKIDKPQLQSMINQQLKLREDWRVPL